MIAATVNPHLSFNGTCEAAFEFYKSVFGGEFTELHRIKDIPGQEVPDLEKEKIMHVSLRLTEHVCLMGCDTTEIFSPPAKFGNNITLTISPASDAETQRLYDALSAGGAIEFPLQKTFWADLYTVFTDKFGTCWALNFMKSGA